MEISVDNNQADSNRSGFFSTVTQTVQGLVSRLIGIITLTEEEKLEAGIYLGGEGRE